MICPRRNVILPTVIFPRQSHQPKGQHAGNLDSAVAVRTYLSPFQPDHMRLMVRFDSCGKGCAESMASSVSTGRTSERK